MVGRVAGMVLVGLVGLNGWGVGAQTPAPAVKATGVGDARVRRLMTELRPVATFRVGGDPDWMAVTADAVWVTVDKRNAVVRLDARTNKVDGEVTVAKPCSGLAAGFGSLWAPSCGDHDLVRVDLRTRKVVGRIAAVPADSEGGIAVGAGSVWMMTDSKGGPDGVLLRVNPSTNKVAARIRVPAESYAAAFGGGSVWVTSTGQNLVTRVDAATNKVVSETKVGKGPRFLTVGAGSVWTLNQGDGTVSRVSMKSGRLTATIRAGLAGHGGEIAYGAGAVWATLEGFPMTRIDAGTNRVTAQWVGRGGDSIRVGLGSVWLTDYEGGVVWRVGVK
jgi:YVTN family beta-propeller protein